jgi:hypothetical protein
VGPTLKKKRESCLKKTVLWDGEVLTTKKPWFLSGKRTIQGEWRGQKKTPRMMGSLSKEPCAGVGVGVSLPVTRPLTVWELKTHGWQGFKFLLTGKTTKHVLVQGFYLAL